MQVVHDFVEHLRFHILLRVGIDGDDFHRPMTKWEAFNSAVCTFSVRRNDFTLAEGLSFKCKCKVTRRPKNRDESIAAQRLCRLNGCRSPGEGEGLAKDRRKGHRHDRLLRDNLDRALDLGHVVSETLI
jgi:hypothetical protein